MLALEKLTTEQLLSLRPLLISFYLRFDDLGLVFALHLFLACQDVLVTCAMS